MNEKQVGTNIILLNRVDQITIMYIETKYVLNFILY